jgi:hypothetical protein
MSSSGGKATRTPGAVLALPDEVARFPGKEVAPRRRCCPVRPKVSRFRGDLGWAGLVTRHGT